MAQIRQLSSGEWQASGRYPDGQRFKVVDDTKAAVLRRAHEVEDAAPSGLKVEVGAEPARPTPPLSPPQDQADDLPLAPRWSY